MRYGQLLLAKLTRSGFTLEPVDADGLSIRPANRLTPELRDQIRFNGVLLREAALEVRAYTARLLLGIAERMAKHPEEFADLQGPTT